MDGLLIVDKKEGITSFDVIRNVRKEYNTKKVGHIGTLDPLASGVLPVLIGKATKLSDYLMMHDKEYIAKITLGKKTSTGDREGNIIEEKEIEKNKMSKENIEKVLNSFLGESYQIPPMYSAIKVNGKKLYELARENKEIERTPRKINIVKIELLKIENVNENVNLSLQLANNNKQEIDINGKETNSNEQNAANLSWQSIEITYKVQCSKGTYIRTLSEDIAEKLGTVGYMSYLRRTRVGDFKLEDAGKLIDMENIINNIPKYEVEEKDLSKLINGVKIRKHQMNNVNPNLSANVNKKETNEVKSNKHINSKCINKTSQNIKEKTICKLYCNNKFLGYGISEGELVKRDILI